MLKPQRELLEVLFPEVRAKVLRLLVTAAPEKRYVRELARMSGLTLHTVQDELRKLGAIGLVRSRSMGKHRFYCANRGHAAFRHLLGIVQVSAKTPRIHRSALHRQTVRRVRKKQKRSSAGRMPPDRPINWHLFSRRK